MAPIRRAEDACRILIAAIADRESSVIIEEAHAVEAGQGIDGDALPMKAPVAGVKQHTCACLAMWQFLAPHDPASIRREEVHGAQRSPNAGRLPFPIASGIDRVPDDAVIADRPALFGIHKLHGMEWCIFKVT
jgi:hypothetical protein